MPPIDPSSVPGSVQMPVWLLVACIVALALALLGGAKFVVGREATWQAWIRQLYEARVADGEKQIAARDAINRETSKLLAENTTAMIRLANVLSALLRQERSKRHDRGPELEPLTEGGIS